MGDLTVSISGTSGGGTGSFGAGPYSGAVTVTDATTTYDNNTGTWTPYSAGAVNVQGGETIGYQGRATYNPVT